LIDVDATAVPDRPSGVRTRLRGLYAAYGRLAGVPEVRLVVARNSTLLAECELGRVSVAEARPAPGPLLRCVRRLLEPTARAAREPLTHHETLPPGRAPALVTIHDVRYLLSPYESGLGWTAHTIRKAAYRTFLRRVLRRTAEVVTVSEATRLSLLERLGLEPSRVHVVENARWLEPVEARPSRATGPAFLLTVGHLEARKGLDLVIEALGLLRRSGREVPCLRVVGDGPARPAWQRRARSLGVHQEVQLLGPRPDTEVASLYRQARALVFPSRHEGFGFPVYEALAHGCPALVTPLPCFDGLPAPAVRAIPAEPVRWADALSETVQQPGPFRDAVGAARETLRSSTWTHSAEVLADVYERFSATCSRTR